jgi:hypothetical protein
MVLAHNIIPHHHHSGHNLALQHCEQDVQNVPFCDHAEHIDHTFTIFAACCANNHLHPICSFDEEIVLTKWISLSNLFLPSTELIFSDFAQNIKSLPDPYLSIWIEEPYCRDVQHRGPPQFLLIKG